MNKLNHLFLQRPPSYRVYSSQGLKAKKVKIKAGVTIGPERRRSRKCCAEEQS